MRSPYRDLWAKINRVIVRTKDKYRGKPYFPIGTRRPISSYDPDKDIPERELKFFKLDTTAPDNSTSVCLIGQAGTFKTTLIKTLTYYNSLLPNTRIGIMSLKEWGLDWDKVNYPHHSRGMLFPNEPATMRMVSGCPDFATGDMTEKDKKRTKIMNLRPDEFADLRVLTGLGFSPMAKNFLLKMLQEGMQPDQIMKTVEDLYRKKKIPKPSYDNINILFDNMVRNNFFSKKNYFDMDAIWDSGSHWALGFNDKQMEFLSVYVDKMLTKIFDRANSSKGRKERYWVVVDDAGKAFGTYDRMKFPSIQRGIDSLNLWRSVGINMVISAQSPTLLNEEIFSDIKHFFIYRCANVGVLSKYIPNSQILDEIKQLDWRPSQFISQCIAIPPSRLTYEKFYPFHSPLG